MCRAVRELKRKGVPLGAMSRYLRYDIKWLATFLRTGRLTYNLRCRLAWLIKALDDGTLTVTRSRRWQLDLVALPERLQSGGPSDMPVLTFRCGNTRCGVEYDTTKPEPRCPKCRSKKAQWVPVRLAIRKVATQVDRDVRIASEQYGMSDFRKPYPGEAMAIRRAATPIGVTPDAIQLGGVGSPVPVYRDPSGKIASELSRCEPCGLGPKITPKMGNRLSEDRRSASLTPRTIIAAATQQRTLPE